MIELIAQATTPTGQPLSATSLLMALAALLGAVRILYVLDGDLSSVQPVMSDPIGFAVKESATHDEIRNGKWQGLRAIVVAHQLDRYINRFGWLLKTQTGSGLCLVLMALFIILFVRDQFVPSGTAAQDFELKAAGVIILAWTMLIEKCKAMKKAVELLRVS